MRRPDSRRRLVRIGALVAVAGVLAATVGTASFLQQDNEKSTPRNEVELTGAAKELADLLDLDRQATFHARYAATSAESPGVSITIETWRKPPRVRQDSNVASEGRVIRTRVLVLDDGTVRCGQLADTPWRCERLAGQDAQDLVFGDVRDQLGKGKVTARDDAVDGRKVRCFTLSGGDRTSEMCATDEGIPVRVRSGGTKLRLDSLDRQVTNEVFEPPAEPSPA